MPGMDQTVAPRERINITYKPATGDAKEEIELPLKLMMIGDYTLRPNDTPLGERKTVNIDKDNFDQVLAKQDLAVSMSVKDKLSGREDEDIGVELKFGSLKDFSPEAIVRQVPELKQLLESREALAALKAPLANRRQVAKKLQEIVKDEETRKKLMGGLGLSEEGGS